MSADSINLAQLLVRIEARGVDLSHYDRRRPLLLVASAQQTLSQVQPESGKVSQYPVSTSRYGTGQLEGSNQTPLGLHRIAQKIGAGEPAGRVFKARVATELICLPGHQVSREDVISSRILWLEGLEPGFNRDGEVDSKQRYIYIHGTADEAHIGQPASIGCVRMRNDDVIEIFDRVEIGDLVLIE